MGRNWVGLCYWMLWGVVGVFGFFRVEKGEKMLWMRGSGGGCEG